MDPHGAYSQLIRLQEGEKEAEGSRNYEVDKLRDNLNIDIHMAGSSTQRISFVRSISQTSSVSHRHSQLSGEIVESDIEQGQIDNNEKPTMSKKKSIWRLAKLNKPELPVIYCLETSLQW